MNCFEIRNRAEIRGNIYDLVKLFGLRPCLRVKFRIGNGDCRETCDHRKKFFLFRGECSFSPRDKPSTAPSLFEVRNGAASNVPAGTKSPKSATPDLPLR